MKNKQYVTKVKCSCPHHVGIQGEYWCSSTLNTITT